MVLNSKEYWATGVSNASVELLGSTFWKNFNLKVEENKIKEHLLINSDFRNIVHVKKSKFRESKVLPAQMTQVTEIVIFQDKTAIIVYSESPLTILIEDKMVSDLFKKQFNLFWNFAK